MAKAIFNRTFHWKRKNSPIGFGANASENPQSFPRDFIEAAIAAGAATEVRPKKADASTDP